MLFRSLSVLENAAFSLDAEKLSAAEILARTQGNAAADQQRQQRQPRGRC